MLSQDYCSILSGCVASNYEHLKTKVELQKYDLTRKKEGSTEIAFVNLKLKKYNVLKKSLRSYDYKFLPVSMKIRINM